MNETIAKKKRRVALIDADGIVFAAACTSEAELTDATGCFLETASVDEAYDHVVDRIEEIIRKTDSDTAIVCLSSAANWRKAVYPAYKSNRVEMRMPPFRKRLNEMLQDRKPYPVMMVATLEADDVCGIASGNLSSETTECVICSPDKDLRQIPGLYYACRNDSEVEVITEDEADYFHFFQALVGDPVDGYAGLPKVGKVKAYHILKPAVLSDIDVDHYNVAVFDNRKAWELVKKAYNSRGFDDDYLLQQMRVSRILRSTDWNNETHEVILWTPPELTPTE